MSQMARFVKSFGNWDGVVDAVNPDRARVGILEVVNGDEEREGVEDAVATDGNPEAIGGLANLSEAPTGEEERPKEGARTVG